MQSAWLETERCLLYPFQESDVADAATFLQDPQVMYAWERTFTEEDILALIQDCRNEYEKNGYAIMMVRLKGTLEPVGRAGIRRDTLHGQPVIELAYMLAHRFWGQGFATELARACLRYAFDVLKAPKVYAEVRPMNKASVAVLNRLGMKHEKPAIKIYMGIPMVMLTYSMTKEGFEALQ